MKKKVFLFWVIVYSVLAPGILARAATGIMDDPSQFIMEGGLPEAVDEEVEEWIETKRYAAPAGGSGTVLISFEDYLLGSLEKMETSIDVSVYKISTSEIYSMFAAVLNNHPELYFVNTRLGWSYSQATDLVSRIKVTYADYDRDAVEAEIAKTLAAIDDNMSDLEKVIAIHDYLCVDVEYPYGDLQNDTLGSDVHNLKGAVLDKEAVCDGYASAFQYYMYKLGIPCKIVTNERHAWDQVCLDGKWYMVDVTFDDPVWDQYGNVSHTYLLKSAEGFTGENHTWTVEDYEICDDTTYDNAYWQNTNTQMIYHEGVWYVADVERQLYKHDFAEDDITSEGVYVTTLGGQWFVYGSTSSYYRESFVRLASRYDRLIYSMPDSIWMCDFSGDNKTKIAGADTSGGYIYGMRLVGDEIEYQIAKVPFKEQRTVNRTELESLLDLADAAVSLSAVGLEYNGTEQYLDVTVAYGEQQLVQDKDYTVEFAYPPSGTGIVTVTVTGKGAFYGTNSATYEIYRLEQEIALTDTKITRGYGTAAFLIKATVKGGTLEYESDAPEVVTVDENGQVSIVGAGTATITISTEGTIFYRPAKAELNVEITPAGLPQNGTAAACVYTGLEVKPEAVIDGLVRGKDFTITGYENNRNAADQNDVAAPAVIVEGIGNYTGTQKIFFTIEKAEPGDLAAGPELKAIYYGQTLEESLADTAGSVWFGAAKISGSFHFATTETKPAVTEDAEYEMIFEPDSPNFNKKSYFIKVEVLPYGVAPRLPQAERTVEYEQATVEDLLLPDGWEWTDAAKEVVLEAGQTTDVTAVYTGDGAGNYAVESQVVAITRLACTHNRTQRRDVHAATCGESGYTGDVYCLRCGDRIEKGDILPATRAHSWDEGQVTLEPTLSSEGKKVYTCKVCGATEEVILEPVHKKAEQVITLKQTTVTKMYGEQSFQIEAAAKGGTLDFTSDDLDIAAVDGYGRVTILGVGTVHIIVSTQGDTEYLPAEAVCTIQVAPMPLPAQAELVHTSYVYTGSSIEPEVILQGLTVGKDYTLTYENNCNVAAADAQEAPAVVVTGMGHYSGTQRLSFTIEKAELGEIADAPRLRDLYYGQSLTESFAISNGTVWFGKTKVSGVFRFAEADKKPSVTKEAQYELIFVPNSANYKEKTFLTTVQVLPCGTAPGLPAGSRTVEYVQDTVGGVALPENWSWQENFAGVSLLPGVPTEVTAVYTGEDAGNYEVEQQLIVITRLACVHDLTECRDAIAVTCGRDGYTGDMYCMTCGEQVAQGEAIPATGLHNWDEGHVTKDPTVTTEGEIEYICEVCGQKREEEIARLIDTEEDFVSEDTGKPAEDTVDSQENPAADSTVDETKDSVADGKDNEAKDSVADGKDNEAKDSVKDSKADETTDPETDLKDGDMTDPEADLKDGDMTDPEADLKDGDVTDPEADGNGDETTDLATDSRDDETKGSSTGSNENNTRNQTTNSVTDSASDASTGKQQGSHTTTTILTGNTEQESQTADQNAADVQAEDTDEEDTDSSTTKKTVTKKTNTSTTFNIKNKKTYKKSTKVSIRDADGIKKITLNGKSLKIKTKAKTVSFKISKYNKYLKKKGKWNKLVVTDVKGKKTTIRFKTK